MNISLIGEIKRANEQTERGSGTGERTDGKLGDMVSNVSKLTKQEEAVAHLT